MKVEAIEHAESSPLNAASSPGPRISNTVRRICEAARIEFAAHGLDESRLTDIAARAGVTKQLIFYHFKSKECLYVAVIDANARDAISRLLARDYEDLTPPEAIHAMLADILREYSETPFQKMSLSARSLQADLHLSTRNLLRQMMPAMVAKIDAILRRGAQSGDFQENVDVGMFYGSALALVYGCFMNESVMSLVLSENILSDSARAAWVEHVSGLLLHTLSPSAPPHPYVRQAVGAPRG